MDGLARALGTLLLTGTVLLCVAGSAIADPALDEFATASGSCVAANGSSQYSLSPDTVGGDQDLDVKIQADGGPGSWSEGLSWQNAGTTWLSGYDLPDNPGHTPPTGSMTCSSGAGFHYTVTYSDRPDTPVEFDGVTQGTALQNQLGFWAPERGHYQAQVDVRNGGSLTLELNGQSQTFSGPKAYMFDLGALDGGPHDIKLSGAAATNYEIYVDERAPGFAQVTPSSTFLAPGHAFSLGFNLLDPALVQHEVLNAQNHVVVQPDDGTVLTPGLHGVSWDGRDDAGRQLPDGKYRVQVDAWNFATGPGQTYADVTIDSTPPAISITSPNPAGPRAAVEFTVTDPAKLPIYPSGIASVTASADGRPPVKLNQNLVWGLGKYQYGYLAPGGWTAGKHTVSVVAVDAAGNRATASTTFTILASAFPASCSTAAIKTAVRGSKSLISALRHLAHKPHGDVFRTFLIDHRLCGDVTGDYVKELVVLLKEQHGSKTALAVFSQHGANWSLAYRDTRHSISNIKLTIFGLYEDTYLHGEILKEWRLHWSGHRFTRAAVK